MYEKGCLNDKMGIYYEVIDKIDMLIKEQNKQEGE